MSLSQNAEPVSPDSPHLPSPTPPMTMANRLFANFRPTSSSSVPSPSSTTEETATETPNPLPGDDTAAPTWSTDAPSAAPPPEAEPSGILSIGRSGRVSKAGIRTAIGGGVRRLCRLVAVFAADEEERALGLWAPDPEDIEDIAEPAANLVYRRVPEEARGGDALDLIQLALAVAGYVGKNVQRRSLIRAHRLAAQVAGEEPQGIRLHE